VVSARPEAEVEFAIAACDCATADGASSWTTSAAALACWIDRNNPSWRAIWSTPCAAEPSRAAAITPQADALAADALAADALAADALAADAAADSVA